MAVYYARITGAILLIMGVIGAAGFHLQSTFSLLTPGQIAIHIVVGAIALIIGLTNSRQSMLPRTYARWISVFFLLLTIVGYIRPALLGDPSLLFLSPGDNMVHLIAGLWGAYVGYFAPPPAMAADLHHAAGHA